uniref:FimB/Mfa2 family fimbrial subunit n=1 Tax=Phocaeicola vulgatus TaxID=821 RepID=UPI004027F161
MIKKILSVRSAMTASVAAIMAFCSVSCSTVTEELPPCEHYIGFSYDYNMMYTDAFGAEVKKLDVYVFDEDDRFVKRYSDEAVTSFGDGYCIRCDLPAGKYRLVAWAGRYARSYEFTEEVTLPQELTVRMKRKADGTQDEELDALWHGEAEMVIEENAYGITEVSLAKVTNKFRIVVQGADGVPLKDENISFAITADNGFVAHDNSLLPDEMVVYRPYFSTWQDLGEGGTVSEVVAAELNTMRLMEDAGMKLNIFCDDGEQIADINLVKYLLLTKMEGYDMTAQEYLDRQDEYVMIFFLQKDSTGKYFVAEIKINDWIIRPQPGDL